MKNKLLWLTTGTGITVVVLFLATMTVGSIYTSTPDSCVNCHEMSTQYMSWQRSSHKSISCIACHSGTGVTGWIGAKAGGVRKMYKHFFTEVGDIHTSVADKVCLQCHYTTKDKNHVYDKRLHDDPLLVPTKIHTDHFEEKDISCMTCHKGMVHGSIGGDVAIVKENLSRSVTQEKKLC